MLRNDLITHLSRHDNDPVAVNVNGVLIDVDAVATEQGHLILVLNPDTAPAPTPVDQASSPPHPAR